MWGRDNRGKSLTVKGVAPVVPLKLPLGELVGAEKGALDDGKYDSGGQ